MKTRSLFTAIAVSAVLCMAVPAAAETFTSANGVLSIDLPNENWKEIVDPTKWIALSDGANQITIEHYSNGEKLPDITVANDNYVNTYQAVFSTQNEVFIITGEVVDAAVIPEIANAIISTKVLQFDTKLAVKKDAENAVNIGDYAVVPMDVTLYVVSDGLNVRNGCSTTDQIIGGLGYGSSVHVIGKVQRSGADIGWFQVAYNSGYGFVSSQFLSETQPPAKESSASTEAGTSYTGDVKTLYEIDGHAVTVYKATDGYWYDKAGTQYSQITDYEFTASNGAPLSVNKPQTQNTNVPVDEPFTAFWENGNTTTLTKYSDGYFYSSDWVRYSSNGDGTYSGADGTKLYLSDPWNANAGNSGSAVQHTLVSRSTGSQVTIWESDGALVDGAGNYYYYADDGSLYDDNEERYDMIS